MRIKEAQEEVKRIGKDIQHPRMASFVALTEEVGEIADQIMKVEVYEETKDTTKLKEEICDVLFSLLELASVYDMDLEEDFKKKLKDLDVRADEWRAQGFMEVMKKKREKHD